MYRADVLEKRPIACFSVKCEALDSNRSSEALSRRMQTIFSYFLLAKGSSILQQMKPSSKVLQQLVPGHIVNTWHSVDRNQRLLELFD